MKVYKDIDLSEFEFWAGAKENYELLNEEQSRQLQFIIEDLYPDGIEEVTLNDIFWFDFDWLCECLDTTWEELQNVQKCESK